MLGGAAAPLEKTGSPTFAISAMSRTGASVTAAATPRWAKRATKISPSVAAAVDSRPSMTMTAAGGTGLDRFAKRAGGQVAVRRGQILATGYEAHRERLSNHSLLGARDPMNAAHPDRTHAALQQDHADGGGADRFQLTEGIGGGLVVGRVRGHADDFDGTGN